ncbi:MAG: hypothetical protein Fur0022_01560 [Anaerolineales bacterium]
MGDGMNQTGATDHGGSQAGAMNHGGSKTGATGHSGSQTGATVHGANPSAGHTPSPPQIGTSSFIRRFTVGTGYVALGLLAVTLLIGPANLLFRKRNPVSNYLRRDVGTWTAIFSVIHVLFGLQAHGSGLLGYFLAPTGSPLTNSFGLGNWTGLAATVIVVGLLAISSNFALRKLKAGPWKWLQRLNYALFALVILHAFFYGAFLRTTSPYTLLLLLIVLAVFVGQAAGVWLWRRRHARTAARQAA